MAEPLPLATIHAAVFEFLRGRRDTALFGAQAVNSYASEVRATEDVDIASSQAEALAEELRRYLHDRFYIAARVRAVRGGIGFRIYERRKPKNRHLVDVRPVTELPPSESRDGIAVVEPAELIANKVASIAGRGHKDKGLTDTRDLRVLLRTFPELQAEEGPVRERLEANGVDKAVFDLWRQWVAWEIEPEDDDDEFDW